MPNQTSNEITNLSFTNLSRNPSIVNLTTDCKAILGLGLKFIPTPRNVTQKEYFEHYRPSLRRYLWRIHFINETSKFFDPRLKIKHNKENLPPLTEHPRTVTRTFNRMIEEAVSTLPEDQNLTKRDTKFIGMVERLMKCQDIIIRESDKNLGLVVLDLEEYDRMVMNHLSNELVYDMCEENAQAVLSRLFEREEQVLGFLLRFHVSKFSTQQWQFLKHRDTTRMPKFYILPKIHKSPIGSRPIVGAFNSPTTRISTVLEILLQKELEKEPQILRDSIELAQHLNSMRNIPSGSFLVSLDVVALYPNINLMHLKSTIHKTGMRHILKMIEFVLHNSYFEYNDIIYHQKTGIPMGTNAAVSIANWYLAKTIDCNLMAMPQISWFKRYVDDIFFIWTGSKEELILIKDVWNAAGTGLKYTEVISNNHLSMLDILVMKDSFERISYKTYQKPNNKGLYIPAKSSHTKHTLKGFIHGELIRFARTCSSEFFYNQQKYLFAKKLKARGYSNDLLKSIFSKHKYHRKFLKKQKSKSRPISFIKMRYTPDKRLHDKVYQAIQYANTAIDSPKLSISWSKSQNLKSYLVKPNYTPYQKQRLLDIQKNKRRRLV
jgi:ferritin